MKIGFRKEDPADAELLTDIQAIPHNSSFYSDHIKYGECPGYGKAVEMMKQSIVESPGFVILCIGTGLH